MNAQRNQFDRRYRANIEKQVMISIMEASTDPNTGGTPVRSVETIDALLNIVSLFAGMQVTSKDELDKMTSYHQRVLKERTANYFRQYQAGDGPNVNVQREYE